MSPMQSDHAAKVMAFLERHRLPPSPQNYTLAYIALNDAGSPMGRAVEAIIAEGYRIKQDEADEIFDRHGGIAIFGSQERNDGELTAHLRHQAIKLGELASSAADATGAFARELSEEAGAFSGDSSNTLSIVARMIEQSLDTQTRLTAAMDEVKALREELEAARHDAQRDELTGLANRRAIDGYLGELAAKGEPRIIALCEAAAYFAFDVLEDGGTFVAKVLAGGAEGELQKLLKMRFTKVANIKPPASRADSSEKFVVATGFKGNEA